MEGMAPLTSRGIGYLPWIDRVFGVDFSGASDAGRKIWLCEAVPVPGGLRILRCAPLAWLAQTKQRDAALAELVRIVASHDTAVFGMDFPFGLPRSVVGDDCWEDLVRKFLDRFPDAEAFHRLTHDACGGKEPRRLTDQAARTPFAPNNLKLYKQTFHGIAHVLRPLIVRDAARVLPMQDPVPGKPVVIEVCPASTLKRDGLSRPYKDGPGKDLRAQRAALLAELARRFGLVFGDPDLERVIVDNREGDALDSVVAAVAASRALYGGLNAPTLLGSPYDVEGWVYI